MYFDNIHIDLVHGNTLYESKTKIETSGRRTTGTEKGKGDTHHRKQIETHAKIKSHLGSNHPEKAKTNATSERFCCMTCNINSAHQ